MVLNQTYGSEGWNEVRWRQKGKVVVREGEEGEPEVYSRKEKGPRQGDDQTSFFFTNIPPNYRAKDLWNI